RADEHARGAGRELAGVNISLDRLRQFQQAHGVADMTATFANDLGDILVTMLVLARERLISGGFLQRIKIGALHVLDDRKLERLAIGCFERSEEHTSELQSRGHLVCRLLLEKKKKKQKNQQ